MGPADKYRSLIVIIDLREHSQTTKLVIPVQTDPHFASRTSYRGQLVRNNQLVSDYLRQIWRNHLLGLSMVKNNDIDKFISATLYPSGNDHFQHALSDYRSHLHPSAQKDVFGCTF